MLSELSTVDCTIYTSDPLTVSVYLKLSSPSLNLPNFPLPKGLPNSDAIFLANSIDPLPEKNFN